MRLHLGYLTPGSAPLVDYQGAWHYIQETVFPMAPFGGTANGSAATVTTATTTLGFSGGEGAAIQAYIRSMTSNTATTSYSRWEWAPALSQTRVSIPMMDFRLDQLMGVLRRSQLPIEDGILYITIRSSFEYEGSHGRWVIAGIAMFPGDTPIPNVFEGDLDTVERFCKIKHTDPEPEEEALRGAWRTVCALHAALEAERHRKEEASQRSLQLLKNHLNEAQTAELMSKQHFTVIGRDRRPYKISTRSHGNVWLLSPDGREMMNFCIVVQDSTIPIFDQMLTQKLLLEYDLETFFRIANPRALLPDADEIQRTGMIRRAFAMANQLANERAG